MSVILNVNGTNFTYPTDGENPGWGQQASAWAQAVTSGMLQKQGGNFTLTALVDFGANFGLRMIELQLRNVANTFRHSFKATNITANVNYELPPTDGTVNQCLATNGSGTLSWISPVAPPSGLLPIPINTTASFGVAATDSLMYPFMNVQNTHVVTLNGKLVSANVVISSGGSIVINPTGGLYVLD